MGSWTPWACSYRGPLSVHYVFRDVIQIKLADRTPCAADDPMGRDRRGYDRTVPVADLFARNRGVWKLGARADLETHAMFGYTGDRRIKFVVEIYGIERFGDRRAFIGRVLDPNDPIAQRWVGTSGYRQVPEPDSLSA